jgi:hypothetical protein
LHPLIDAPRKIHSITPSARAVVKTPTLDHWTYHDLRRSFASGLAPDETRAAMGQLGAHSVEEARGLAIRHAGALQF